MPFHDRHLPCRQGEGTSLKGKRRKKVVKRKLCCVGRDVVTVMSKKKKKKVRLRGWALLCLRRSHASKKLRRDIA